MLTDETRDELTKSLPAILTVPEAAEALRCSPATIRREIAAGKLEAFTAAEDRIRVCIARADFIAWADRQGNQ